MINIIGPKRFQETIDMLEARIANVGVATFTPVRFTNAVDGINFENMHQTEDVKIVKSTAVLVVDTDFDGEVVHFGDDTKREIETAERYSIPVYYLSHILPIFRN